MSSSPLIAFDGVSKKFRRGAAHDSLRDLIPALARRVLQRGQRPNERSNEFWALRDLSFEVKPGEVLGIIGSNGAGKSTTLKILNGIMEPTSGRVRAVGKIAALIEVGAGFHQDLTGRQNVYLQGAIMGMRKAEVERKFDAIVDFSGIEDFIDTPVKRYSSGMNARLGFSIAAHLDPEILIIDEVLAVGDHAFQNRAFGRIKEMAMAGAPVVLVSHQLDRILSLSTKGIVLSRGSVAYAGSPIDCVNQYMASLNATQVADSAGEQKIQFERVGSTSGLTVRSGETLAFFFEGVSKLSESVSTWTPSFRIFPFNGDAVQSVYAINGADHGIPLPVLGQFRHDVSLQANLRPGLYTVEVSIRDVANHTDVVAGPRLQFEVQDGLMFHGPNQLNAAWTVAG